MKTIKRPFYSLSLSLGLILLSILVCPSLAGAAPGDLDPAFGGGTGFVTTDFGSVGLEFQWDRVHAIAFQEWDGKFVVAGSTGSGPGLPYPIFALARYDNSGSLDPAFGIGGLVKTDFSKILEGSGSSNYAFAVAVQEDHKIVVAERVSAGGILVRYNENGSLDTKFGTGGIVTTSWPAAPSGVKIMYALHRMTIQSDGKIVACGPIAGGYFAMVRYHTDGTLDSSFGTGGRVTMEPVGLLSCAGIARQTAPNDKIVVAGSARHSATDSTYDFAVARYGEDGTLDKTFGSNGVTTTDIALLWNEPFGLAVQPLDGKIILAGYVIGDGVVPGIEKVDFAVVRYNDGGSLDLSFGNFSGGISVTDFNLQYDYASAVAVGPDGRIFVAGHTGDHGLPPDDFALACYETTGKSCVDFSSPPLWGAGWVTTDISGGGFEDQAKAIVIQPDRKVVVAGYAYVFGNGEDFAIARYLGF